MKQKKNSYFKLTGTLILLSILSQTALAEDTTAPSTPKTIAGSGKAPGTDEANAMNESTSSTGEAPRPEVIPSPEDNETPPEKSTDTLDDPIVRACKDASPGEQRIVEGMTVTCRAGQDKSVEKFNFQSSQPVAVPSEGFVGFSNKYLNTLYLTLGTGYTNHASMVSYGDLDRKNMIYEAAGFDATSTASPHDFAINFAIGYLANEFVLIEMGYSYLGSINISTDYTDGVNTYTATHDAGMSTMDLSVYGRFNFAKAMIQPIAARINALTIAEAHQWSRSNVLKAAGTTTTTEESGWGFGFGVGGEFQVNEFVTTRLMWKYKTFGNEGINTIMLNAVMMNNTVYAQAIQNSIVNPILGIFKR